MKQKIINVFKKIKSIMTKKEELEQQLADAIAVSQRLGAENKELRQINDNLISTNTKLAEELNGAIERVRSLAGQVKMLELQNQSRTRYSDSDKNY